MAIDIKATVVGDAAITRTLHEAHDSLRKAFRKELRDWGRQIVGGAQARVPVRTGTLRDSIKMKFSANEERIRVEVRPRHFTAPMIERGVHGTFKRKARASKNLLRGGRRQGSDVTLRERLFKTEQYQQNIPAHPFFMPAVDAAGGVDGALERIESVLSSVVRAANGA